MSRIYDFDNEIISMLRSNRILRENSPKLRNFNIMEKVQTPVKQEAEAPEPEFKNEEPIEIVDTLETSQEDRKDLIPLTDHEQNQDQDNEDARSDVTEPFSLAQERRFSADSDVMIVDWPVYSFEQEDWYKRALPLPIQIPEIKQEVDVKLENIEMPATVEVTRPATPENLPVPEPAVAEPAPKIPEPAQIQETTKSAGKTKEDPPLQCPYCYRFYKLGHTLRKHIKTKHVTKPFNFLSTPKASPAVQKEIERSSEATLEQTPTVEAERPVIAVERPVIAAERPVIAAERPVVEKPAPSAIDDDLNLLEELPRVRKIRARAKTVCVESFQSRRFDSLQVKQEALENNSDPEETPTRELSNLQRAPKNSSLRRSGRLSSRYDEELSYRRFFEDTSDSDSTIVSQKRPYETRQQAKHTKIRKLNESIEISDIPVRTGTPEDSVVMDRRIVTPLIVRMPTSKETIPVVFKKPKRSLDLLLATLDTSEKSEKPVELEATNIAGTQAGIREENQQEAQQDVQQETRQEALLDNLETELEIIHGNPSGNQEQTLVVEQTNLQDSQVSKDREWSQEDQRSSKENQKSKEIPQGTKKIHENRNDQKKQGSQKIQENKKIQENLQITKKIQDQRTRKIQENQKNLETRRINENLKKLETQRIREIQKNQENLSRTRKIQENHKILETQRIREMQKNQERQREQENPQITKKIQENQKTLESLESLRINENQNNQECQRNQGKEKIQQLPALSQTSVQKTVPETSIQSRVREEILKKQRNHEKLPEKLQEKIPERPKVQNIEKIIQTAFQTQPHRPNSLAEKIFHRRNSEAARTHHSKESQAQKIHHRRSSHNPQASSSYQHRTFQPAQFKAHQSFSTPQKNPTADKYFEGISATPKNHEKSLKSLPHKSLSKTIHLKNLMKKSQLEISGKQKLIAAAARPEPTKSERKEFGSSTRKEIGSSGRKEFGSPGNNKNFENNIKNIISECASNISQRSGHSYLKNPLSSPVGNSENSWQTESRPSPFENIMKNIEKSSGQIRSHESQSQMKFLQLEDGRSKTQIRQRSRSMAQDPYDEYEFRDDEEDRALYAPNIPIQLRNDIKLCWKNFQMKFVKDLNKTLTKSMENFVGRRENRKNSTINICVQYGEKPQTPAHENPPILKYKSKEMLQRASEFPEKACPWCDETFGVKQELVEHLKQQHLQFDASKTSLPFKCPDCDQIFHEKDDYRRHCARVHRIAYKCTYPECKQDFSNYELMCEHIQVDHMGQKRKAGVLTSFGDEIAILDRRIYGADQKKNSRMSKRSKTIDCTDASKFGMQEYRLKSSKPQNFSVRKSSVPRRNSSPDYYRSRSLCRDSGRRSSMGSESGSRDSLYRDSGSRDSSSQDSGSRHSAGSSGSRDSRNRDSRSRDSGDFGTSKEVLDPKLLAVTSKIKETTHKRRKSILIDIPDDSESWDNFNRRKKQKLSGNSEDPPNSGAKIHKKPQLRSKRLDFGETSTPKVPEKSARKLPDSSIEESPIPKSAPDQIQKIKETLARVLKEQNLNRIRETLMEAVNELTVQLSDQEVEKEVEIVEIPEPIKKTPEKSKTAQNSYKSLRGQFFCKFCKNPKPYAYEKWLFKHENEKHAQQIPEGSKQCQDCNQIISDDLKRHHCRNRCSKCKKKVEFYGEFKNHKCMERRKTIDADKYDCSLCTSSFAYARNLRKHWIKNHGEADD